MSGKAIEIPIETAAMGVAFGLMRWDSEEQCYELTPSGDKWVREWLAERLEEHKANQTEGA